MRGTLASAALCGLTAVLNCFVTDSFLLLLFFGLDGDLRLCAQGAGQDQGGPTQDRYPGHKLLAVLAHALAVYDGHQRVRHAVRHQLVQPLGHGESRTRSAVSPTLCLTKLRLSSDYTAGVCLCLTYICCLPPL